MKRLKSWEKFNFRPHKYKRKLMTKKRGENRIEFMMSENFSAANIYSVHEVHIF